MANILITGASDGLGRALARELAGAGHHLVVHGRDAGRLASIARETGAVAIRADLSSLDEVRGLAAQAAGIDVLVNNAGVGFGAPGAGRELSRDGYELRLAVNYLAPYLLTRLLLPVLRRSGSARIVNVASAGQRPVDLDDLMMEREYAGVEAYRRSKLALIAHTFDLAGELAGFRRHGQLPASGLSDADRDGARAALSLTGASESFSRSGGGEVPIRRKGAVAKSADEIAVADDIAQAAGHRRKTSFKVRRPSSR